MKQYKTGKEIYRIGQLYYGDTGHCSVVAVAVSCNVGYGRALKEMSNQGRMLRTGANVSQIHGAIRNLGFDVVKYDLEVNGTVSTITKKLPKIGTFIAYVRSHILTIRDGEVIDWTEGRKHRIIRVMEVVKC